MTGLIILAAGASNRLGKPKQNLLFEHKTLLQRAIETGLNSECRPIIVVLGANADLIDLPDQHNDIDIIHNHDWNKGMASSITIALKEIKKNRAINNVIIMLCDQPFVDTPLINNLILKQQQTGKTIIACSYENTVGVPVLFNKLLFDELLLLKGDEGAKNILKKHTQHLVSIPFDKGSIDIDTIADYKRLIS